MNTRLTVLSVFGFALLLSTVPLWAESNQAVESALKSKEQAAWQAWKDRDQKAMDPIITEDAINIADGVMDKGKEKILKDMMAPGCTVNSFSLSDFAFLWIDKDAVILTYNATQDVTCGDKKQPGKVIASSVWQKKNGKWVSPFHQETTAEGM